MVLAVRWEIFLLAMNPDPEQIYIKSIKENCKKCLSIDKKCRNKQRNERIGIGERKNVNIVDNIRLK
jgi:hypothetical protein